MEAAHFPKEPAHTGLTILDQLPKKKKKKKKNTRKVTKLRIEENSNDLSRCLFINAVAKRPPAGQGFKITK